MKKDWMKKIKEKLHYEELYLEKYPGLYTKYKKWMKNGGNKGI